MTDIPHALLTVIEMWSLKFRKHTRSVNVECTGVNKKIIQTRMFFKMSVRIHSSLSFNEHLSFLLYFLFQRNDVTFSDVRYTPLVPHCILKINIFLGIKGFNIVTYTVTSPKF